MNREISISDSDSTSSTTLSCIRVIPRNIVADRRKSFIDKIDKSPEISKSDSKNKIVKENEENEFKRETSVNEINLNYEPKKLNIKKRNVYLVGRSASDSRISCDLYKNKEDENHRENSKHRSRKEIFKDEREKQTEVSSLLIIFLFPLLAYFISRVAFCYFTLLKTIRRPRA